MSMAVTPAAPPSPFVAASVSPSVIITMQNGHAVATVVAPVSSTWRVRSALIRVPRVLLHPHPPAAGAAAERVASGPSPSR